MDFLFVHRAGPAGSFTSPLLFVFLVYGRLVSAYAAQLVVLGVYIYWSLCAQESVLSDRKGQQLPRYVVPEFAFWGDRLAYHAAQQPNVRTIESRFAVVIS